MRGADPVRHDEPRRRRVALGERAIAEYVAEHLTDSGFAPQLLERAPTRSNVVARVPGADPSLPPLLVHAHLDVVPADPAEWTVPPFAGEIRDGYVWGRGAVDMKDMCATLLTVLSRWSVERHRAATGPRAGVRRRRGGQRRLGRPLAGRGAPGTCSRTAPRRSASPAATPSRANHADGAPVRLYPVATAERGTVTPAPDRRPAGQATARAATTTTPSSTLVERAVPAGRTPSGRCT